MFYSCVLSSFNNNLLVVFIYFSSLPPHLRAARSEHVAVEVLEDAVPHQARGERQRLDGAQPHGVEGHLSGGGLLLSGFGRERPCGNKKKNTWKLWCFFTLSPGAEELMTRCTTGVLCPQYNYAFKSVLTLMGMLTFALLSFELFEIRDWMAVLRKHIAAMLKKNKKKKQRKKKTSVSCCHMKVSPFT